jgi:hypothetical protein
MPKVRASSTRMGTTRGPISLSRSSVRQEAHIGLGRRDLAAFGGRVHHGLEGGEVGHLEAASSALARRLGQVAAQGLAALVQVASSPASLRPACRTGSWASFFVRDTGMLKRSRNRADVVVEVSFLVWWAMFLPSPALPMPIALDGLDQQHGRLAVLVLTAACGRPHRPSAGRGRRAATRQMSSSLILATSSSGLGIFAEEVLAHEGAVVGLHGLVVAVERLVHHDLAQLAVSCRAPAAGPSSRPRSA